MRPVHEARLHCASLPVLGVYSACVSTAMPCPMQHDRHARVDVHRNSFVSASAALRAQYAYD